MNKRGLFLAAALHAAMPLAAHDFWIEPSTFQPPVGSPVAVNLLVGEHLAGERVIPRPEAVERFVAIDASGEMRIEGELVIDRPGLTRVIYRSRPSPITLDAVTFERYLRDEGLERVIAARAARGESDKDATEIYSRCAKSLLRPSGAMGRDRASGLPLEIIAESDRSFVLSYLDAPLGDALVVAMHASGTVLRARTNAAGRVKFPIRKPGLWLIKNVHMIPAPPDSGAEWESLWASLTFHRQ